MSLLHHLQSVTQVFIRQKRELAEVFGFETRNKYSIELEDGTQVGFAAEQQKGFFGILMRQALGHWRKFDINLYGPERQLEFVAHHPFRFYYQKLEVRGVSGELIGSLERRFEILGKRFDLTDRSGQVLMSVRSPLWRIWTFPFKKDGQEHAVVVKKWGGLVKEIFLDADSFALNFISPNLTPDHKILLLAAAIFVDLRYFEKKAGGGASSMYDLMTPG